MPSVLACSAMLLSAVINASSPESLRQQLQAAEQASNEDPRDGIARLEAALQAVHQEAVNVAGDRELHELRLSAQLALARALLAAGEDLRAEAAMDEALRSAGKTSLPVTSFGPALEALHAERSARLQERGRGSLSVKCSIPCNVYVNEQLASDRVDQLIAGRYRIVVASEIGNTPKWRTNVDILTAGQVVTLHYPGPPSQASTPDASSQLERTPVASDDRAAKAGRRMLPRWLEIVGLTAGAGMLAGGTASLLIDGRCSDGSTDTNGSTDTDPCTYVWETTNLGIGLLAAGGTLTLLSVILLATDEHRVRRKHIAWTGTGLRF